MPFLFLLIFLFWVFPYLIIPFLVFFAIGFLFLIPYVVFFNSFLNVLTIPWQILKIASDKRVRKNHSLEHATVNVLEERYGKTFLPSFLNNVSCIMAIIIVNFFKMVYV